MADHRNRVADIVSLDRARRLKTDGTTLPEKAVEHWPCRECSSMVGVTKSALEAAAVFDAYLRSRREKPIDRAHTMLCVECAAKWHEREQWRTRDGNPERNQK